MPDSSPFDMDLDGDVDGIDFLGFDYFVRNSQGDTGSDPCAIVLGLAAGLFALIGCLATVWYLLSPSGRLYFLVGSVLVVSAAGLEFLSRTGRTSTVREGRALQRESPPTKEPRPGRRYCETQQRSLQSHSCAAATSFGDAHEDRVPQWKGRTDQTYGSAGKDRGTDVEYHRVAWGRRVDRAPGCAAPEPPPDEWSRDEWGRLMGAPSHRHHLPVHKSYLAYDGDLRRYSDEPTDEFYGRWATEYEDFDSE
jgi:hypothetical protein